MSAMDNPLITTPVDAVAVAALATYDVNEAALAQMREACAAMSATTPEGYEEVRLAIGKLRTTRTAIEKRRVELKADALRFGRMVDGEAARLTKLVADIEDPLKAKKQAVDDEAARQKAEAEAAKLKALEEEIAARRAAQEAEARLQREAEEKRIAAERAKLEEERRALEAERERTRQAEAELQRQRAAELAKVEEAQRLEAARLNAERVKLEEERRQAEAAERERQERLRREEDARQAELARQRRQKEAEEVAPDLDKVMTFRLRVLSVLLEAPQTQSAPLRDIITEAVRDIGYVVDTMERLGKALAGRA